MPQKVKKVFVVPENDAEAATIVKLLVAFGAWVLVTAQQAAARSAQRIAASAGLLVTAEPWGATWAGLEPDIVEALIRFRIENPDGIIYGVELGGPNSFGAVNIDHHRYENEDRSHPLSSLEQVAQLLGVELTRWQRLIAANDVGWIPAMERLGATQAEIDAIRALDRRAQGITPRDELEAQRAVAARQINGRLTTVWMEHARAAAVTDRLYKQYDQLIVLSETGETNFFGDGALCAELQKQFGGWSGGSGLGKPGDNAFWGGHASQDKVLAFIRRQLAI